MLFDIRKLLVHADATAARYNLVSIVQDRSITFEQTYLNYRQMTPPVWETAVHLAVACGAFDGVFCAVLFPTRCLGCDLGLN